MVATPYANGMSANSVVLQMLLITYQSSTPSYIKNVPLPSRLFVTCAYNKCEIDIIAAKKVSVYL